MQLLPNIKQLFVTSGGLPLAGGKLYSYAAGTTTPQATYTDASGGTPNANPLILDANGQGEVWIDSALSYKFTLNDSADVLQWTRDNVKWIPNLSVGTAALIDASVTTAKINDSAVTSAKLNSLAVTTVKIADAAVTTAKMADASITMAKAANNDLCPPGMIVAFGGSTAPTGWLICDGTSYLSATYPALAAALQTVGATPVSNFGAADSTHFNVPDLRGRFLRGWDHGAGNDPDSAGRTAIATNGTTGDKVGSKQSDQIASHLHGIFISDAGGSNGNNPQDTSAATSKSYNSSSTGGNETRPKNVNVQFIIKT